MMNNNCILLGLKELEKKKFKINLGKPVYCLNCWIVFSTCIHCILQNFQLYIGKLNCTLLQFVSVWKETMCVLIWDWLTSVSYMTTVSVSRLLSRSRNWGEEKKSMFTVKRCLHTWVIWVGWILRWCCFAAIGPHLEAGSYSMIDRGCHSDRGSKLVSIEIWG